MQSSCCYFIREFCVNVYELACSLLSFLIWYGDLYGGLSPVNPCLLVFTHLCNPSLSGQSIVGWDGMSFSISGSKNTVTSVLAILTHTSLSDTFLWEKQVTMWWATLWRDPGRKQWCLPSVTGMYSKPAKSHRSELESGEFSQ